MTRICRIVGFFLLVVMISATALGMQPGDAVLVDSSDPAPRAALGAGEGADNFQVVQITNSTNDQILPRISGNRILWMEVERGGTVSLYLYDIANRSAERIIERFSPLTHPEISGNWIGWVEDLSDSSGQFFPCIRVYDIQSGTTAQITQYPAMPYQTSESQDITWERESTLAISGDGIVWHDKRDGNMDIYYRNLSSGDWDVVADSRKDETCPSISGDRVIWAEQHGMKGYTIHLYNLTSRERKQITDLPAMRRNQVISGDYVVWSEWREGDYDICCYNISSGNTTWITEEPAHQLWPRISGNVIVWSRGRDGYGVSAYDLSTETETRILADLAGPVWPDVDGNNIVWSDNRTGNYDVYLCSPGNRSDAAPQLYTVRLNSVPRGADISVNNESRGRTPATLSFDRAGICPIKLEKNGFRPYTTTLDISASMTFVVNLEREGPGTISGPRPILMSITVDSVPRGANVSVDGAVHGTTLFQMDRLPSGDHEVELTLEGYQPNRTTVNSSEPINITLVPETNETDGDRPLLMGRYV